jgi:hypothetical protein
MNKKERFNSQLKRHILALCELYKELTGNELDYFEGIKISKKLRGLEAKISKISLDYCNGVYNNYEEIAPKLNKYEADIKNLFDTDKNFIYINLDPRGFALKINEDFKTDANFFTDWGRYKLLAPELPC